MKILHYYSGLLLALFMGIHLFNHLLILHSKEWHLNFMRLARQVYRHPVVETFLLLALCIQVSTGLILVIAKWNDVRDGFDRLQIASGLYMAFFLLFHVVAVLAGRHRLHLDTNLYFGAGVMHQWPQKLFFIPYYALALASFFGHIACIHRQKMQDFVSLPEATRQSYLIMGLGLIYMTLVIWKMSTMKMPGHPTTG